LGWLTIELVPEVPSGGNFVLREIDHEAVVSLSYQMPVQGSRPANVPNVSAIDDFIGDWVNVDVNTRGMTHLEIAKVNDSTVSFHGYGKCHPSDCDWGVIIVPFTPGTVMGTYNFGFKTTRLTVHFSNGQLLVENFNHFTDGSGRADYTENDILSLRGGGNTSSASGPTLRIDVGALEHKAQGVRSCGKPILSKQEFDRIFEIMTERSFNGKLEIRCFATIGHRTWKQIVVGDINLATQVLAFAEKQLLFTDALNTQTLQAVSLDALSESITTIKVIDDNPTVNVDSFWGVHLIDGVTLMSSRPIMIVSTPTITSMHHETVQPAEAHPVSVSPVLLNPGIPGLVPTLPSTVLASQPTQQASLTTTMSAASPSYLSSRYRAPLRETLSKTDLILDTPTGPKPVIPERMLMEADGTPALIKVRVEADQELAPFYFVKDTNAYMFDLGDFSPSTNHILIPQSIQSDGLSGTFYEDSAFRNRFYYQPTEFRLSRLPRYPYLPDLVMAFFDPIGQDQNGTPTIDFRVELAYRALPYIDPQLLDAARSQLVDPAGPFPMFVALDPVKSDLSLTLPRQGEMARTSAQVSFNEGIVDTVNLPFNEFAAVLSAFEAQAGTGSGLQGTIHAHLFDGTNATVPLTLSLAKTAGPVFSRTFDGPVPGVQGQYRITLRNQIESKVHIDKFYGVRVTQGVLASPVGATPGVVLNPGETLQLTYQVQPANASISDIEPILSVSIEPNLSMLLPLLMVNQGYTSFTFTVNVSTDPHVFDPPSGGGELLTGLKVEFEFDTSVTLTPTKPTMDAVLRMPLLAVILKSSDAKKYRYRVTNISASGEGARTNWIAGEGEGKLPVRPA